MQNSTRHSLIILVGVVASVIAVEAAPYPREQMAVLLFPIATRPVAGADATLWWAELRVHNPGDGDVPFHQGADFCGISPCREVIVPHQTEPLTSRARREWLQGQLAYVDRGMVEQLVFSYQTWVSKDASSRPVAEVPVVGEGDLFSERGVLPHIPVRPTSRITLRIYDVEPNTGNSVRVRIYPAYDGVAMVQPIIDEVHTFNYEGVGTGDFFIFPGVPGSIQLYSLASRYPELMAYDAVRIEVERVAAESGLAFWFFATVTDNETHSVTNYTPNIAH